MPGLDTAEQFPLKRASRHLGVYDPKTGEYAPIGTCFSTHHLMFAEDADNTLWTSGGGQVVGWFNTKVFDQTGDEKAAQGWTPLVLDTNGNGWRDEYVEPDQPLDPSKDKRIAAGFYAVAPAPDGSIWGSSLGFPELSFGWIRARTRRKPRWPSTTNSPWTKQESRWSAFHRAEWRSIATEWPGSPWPAAIWPVLTAER